MVFYIIKMVPILKDNLKMELLMGREYYIIKIKIFGIKVNFKKINFMDMGHYMIIHKLHYVWVFGKKVCLY